MQKAAAAGAATLAAGAVGFKALDSSMNLSADFKTIYRGAKPLLAINKLGKRTDDYSVADVFVDTVSKYGGETFTIFEHRRMTYGDMELFSTQLAHWLLKHGIQAGDVLALVMENKPEFIGWWLAMTKIAAQVALVNYSVKRKGLVHCIKVADSKAVVFDTDTEENVYDVEGDLEARLFYWGPCPPSRPFKDVTTVGHDQMLGLSIDGGPLKELRKGIKMMDNFGFIYTSGTTGLPKAANIMHIKIVAMGNLLGAAGAGPGDRTHCCLPLFHSAGGGIGVLGCILTGSAIVISKKFSASRFWNEISAYGCTGFQYIGELGRFLVNYAKEHPEVYQIPHKLKFAVGNGLRPEVWDDFQDGFKIPAVLEFYGATEGNGALINYSAASDKASRGAVGRVGAILSKVLKPKIVKFDVETDEVVRGPDGLCIECGFMEPGELLFPNVQGDPTKTFKGYRDAKATAKKLLSDGFAKGDSWFRTGDLLAKDSRGFIYFVDRIGDTFRWKGENCSTTEVSEIVSSFPGVEEANVYGIKVPGCMDGRACMAAVQGRAGLQSQERLDDLLELCRRELPKYSLPLFLRFLPEMEQTATFKQQKANLREQGCDPKVVEDAMYWLSPVTGKYEPFGAAEYQGLESGQSKL